MHCKTEPHNVKTSIKTPRFFSGVTCRDGNYMIFGPVLRTFAKKICLSDVFPTCPLVKFSFTYSYFARASMIWIDGDFSFEQPPLLFYLSDTIFTCLRQADSQ